MTTQELKQQIDRVLGNNIRCLLPSYWWKRLFNQVTDRIDEVEQSTSKLIESKVEEVKMPIVESVDELEKLKLAKGSVAAVEKTGEPATVKISDCYFSSNYEEDWGKYTIVKGVEKKDNAIIDNDVAVFFSASKEMITKDAFQVNKLNNGLFYHMKWTDGEVSVTSLEEVNKALSSGKYRAIDYLHDPDDYFTFYSEKPQPSLYIKGDFWERLAKESDLVGIEGGSGDEIREFYIGDSLTDEHKAWNLETAQAILDKKAIVICNGSILGDGITTNNDGSKEFINSVPTPQGVLYAGVKVEEDGTASVFFRQLYLDDKLSDKSINAVQNKVLTEALGIFEEHLAVHSEQIASLGLSMATKEELNNKVDKSDIKTINGVSLLGGGNLQLGEGVSEDYVNTAIANAITNTLNTEV